MSKTTGAGNPSPSHGITGDSVFVALSPFRIDPLFVTRIWGYDDLRPWFDKQAQGEPIGEVWLTGDACRVATGPRTGATLGAIFAEEPEAMLGAHAAALGSPLLLKVIFAREKLSVQVHPDDALAKKSGLPRGKTECWYALDADPGAQVAAGIKADVTAEMMRTAIEKHTLEELLRVLPISKGEMVFVDAGTVHAIWPGSVLFETQQNSDTTYRMYDYGRPRELHIEKSLEAMRLETRAGIVAPQVLPDRSVLIEEDYFAVERIPVDVSRASATLPGAHEHAPGLSYLFAASGSGRITSPSFDEIDLSARGIVAVPAASPVFAVRDMGGLDLLRISPRWPGQKA